jgi:hypothetical protein
VTRGPSDIGDKLKVAALDDSGPISYPLAEIPNNVSYETISEQPEAEPNQPLSIPLSFHGGLAYSAYDPRQAGAFVNNGMLIQEPNIIRPPIAPTTVELTDANSPPMYFFETPGASATITHDDSSSGTGTAGAVTVPHTVASGDDRILIVGSSNVENSSAIPGATYGGVSMTVLVSHRFDPRRATLFYLLNPATGTADVVVTPFGTPDIVVGVSSYTGVDLDNPFGATTTANGTDDAPTLAQVSATNELVVDVLAVNANVTAAVGASQDERWNAIEGTGMRGAGSSEAGAASVTMSWSLSGAGDWALVSTSLKPVAVPRLYAISVESGEVNVYKLSLESGDFGTLLNTKTFSVTTTQPMGRPAEWNDGSDTFWRLGLGDNGKIQELDTIAAGTSDDTWNASADADARHLKVVGNQLIRSTNENQISILPRGSDPMTEANWGGDFFAGDVSSDITELGEASGLGYVAKTVGLFEWDLIGEAINVFPEIGRASRNGQGMIFYHGGFMIPADSGLWWTRTGEPVGPDSNPNNRANDPSLGSADYFRHGRWMGLATFGAYVYALYVSSTGTSAQLAMGRERDDSDPPGWGPLVWQTIDLPTADFNDFHGVFIAELSRFSATETRPSLWYANGNDVSYIWLDKDGAPLSRRGDIDLATTGSVTSGKFDFDIPRVPKQLWAIEGWAEDFGSVTGSFQFNVYRDGGSLEAVGSTITSDGFFRQFWTQDTNDIARALLVNVTWTGTSSITDTNGPHLRDVVLRAIALPRTTRDWTVLFRVEDEQAKTAKKIRSELEGYVGDLKKFTLPDRDTFNGVMGKPRLLRADEIQDLFPRNQPPPKYVISAPLREMAGS